MHRLPNIMMSFDGCSGVSISSYLAACIAECVSTITLPVCMVMAIGVLFVICFQRHHGAYCYVVIIKRTFLKFRTLFSLSSVVVK